jgi:2-polyprenyl-6-methoxyphenol hydroxylase-like FAD-dependent oxidoreductase
MRKVASKEMKGMCMSRGSTEKKHAIIIGGGIAGLLAARVTANHFEKVTLIERDHYPDQPIFRAGAPQGRQLHFLPLRGQRTLEALFPGLGAKLLAQGAIERAYGAEGNGASIFYYYDGRCPQIPPIWHGWNCSRSLIEWQIRKEIETYSHIQIMEGHEVVRLLAEKDHSICGVQFRARAYALNNLQELRSDLVIDASGATSHVVTWLKELGYAVPQEIRNETQVSYATRVYQPARSSPWKEIAIQLRPPYRQGAVLMEIEQGKWMIALSSTGKEELPPTNEERYLAFARALPENALGEAINSATPLSPIYGFRKNGNYMRRFKDQPEGFLILGDALCSFNPVYGQGMTVASLEAVLLDTCLRKYPLKEVAGRFQKKAARLVASPWNLATSADADGNTPVKKYIDGIAEILMHDRQTLLTFLAVIQMVRTPLALLHPMIVAKVLWYQLVTKRRKKTKSLPV